MLSKASLILILVACSASIATAEIYKTVDKNGHVTYTDVPPPNNQGKPVELKTINTLPKPPDVPVSAPPPVAPTPEFEVHVTAPENGTTLLANQRSVVISASVNLSPMPDGTLLAYKLDGNVIQKTTDTSYTLNEPPAGEHAITVEVVNEDNEVLAQSESVTLVVIRPIAKKTNPVPKK